MDFKNKVIWITGASSGIGEALTYEFAKVGAKLILSSRRTEELERVKLNCSLPEENIMVLPLDLEDNKDFSSKVTRVIEKFNTIDILINNAGISSRAAIIDSSVEVYRKLMNVNFFGTISLTKAILPYMVKQQSGHIVTITSGMGKFGMPLRSAYSASKHALHGFFDSLRLEFYEDNIKVTLICPGFVNTNVTINAITSNGEKLNIVTPDMDNGMMPERFAQKVLKAIIKEKREVYSGKKEAMAVYAQRYYPSLLFRRLRKMNIK